MNIKSASSSELLSLRNAFLRYGDGRDIRFVGGCVRDMLAGIEPKDYDLCTDATPNEQMEIYRRLGVRFHETGLQHGTLTVVLGNEVYEITSLRVDRETDGRHAIVEFTQDWTADLARRDLTINAMAADLTGQLFDPFGGLDDLRNQRVRFVGNAGDRIREDYLRILRWVRFHGRFGGPVPDAEAMEACREHIDGLCNISRERVWMEVRRIAIAERAGELFRLMASLGANKALELPFGSHQEVARVAAKTDDPVTVMVAYLSSYAQVRALAFAWKWSNQERTKAEFLAKHYPFSDCDLKRLLAVDEAPLTHVLDLARLQDRDEEISELVTWTIPKFPVRGNDLLDNGHKTGPMIGHKLSFLKDIWAEEGYKAGKEELMTYLHPSTRDIE